MTGSDRSMRTVLGFSVAVALLLGLAAAGGSIVRSTSTEATARQAFPYALMGALAGAAIAGVAILAIRAARPGAKRLRPAELMAVVTIAACVGALLGAASTPRTPSPEEVSPLEDEAIEERERQAEVLADGASAGTVDLDGDGEADVDADGNLIIAIDLDGDGRLDGYLDPCPPGTPIPEPRPGFTAIDTDCDGTVEQWVPFDPSVFLEGEGYDLEALPTIPPSERAERAEEQGASGRRDDALLLVLLIIGAVALCAAIIVWLVRMPDRDGSGGGGDDADDADAEPDADADGAIDLAPSLEASLDTVLEDPDPREAICAAYGRLLDGFAEAGLPRRAEEAPEEHARRCLDGAGMDPVPVRDLLHLFALARFSTHPVDESHRRAAVRAMRAALASAPQHGRVTASASATASGWDPPGAR